MCDVLIITDRTDFGQVLTRGGPLPKGVRLRRPGSSGKGVVLRVRTGEINGTEFSLWVLRKLRLISGSHRIEIGGKAVVLQMPEAIDAIAHAVVAAERERPAA